MHSRVFLSVLLFVLLFCGCEPNKKPTLVSLECSAGKIANLSLELPEEFDSIQTCLQPDCCNSKKHYRVQQASLGFHLPAEWCHTDTMKQYRQLTITHENYFYKMPLRKNYNFNCQKAIEQSKALIEMRGSKIEIIDSVFVEGAYYPIIGYKWIDFWRNQNDTGKFLECALLIRSVPVKFEFASNVKDNHFFSDMIRSMKSIQIIYP